MSPVVTEARTDVVCISQGSRDYNFRDSFRVVCQTDSKLLVSSLSGHDSEYCD